MADTCSVRTDGVAITGQAAGLANVYYNKGNCNVQVVSDFHIGFALLCRKTVLAML